ncbi:MAG: hypothetical protein ACK5NB_07055 [Flavobacteriaceae bacterium]
MLYTKNKKNAKKKRSYEHLHVHASSEQIHRLKSVGKVFLNGKPKLKPTN